MLVSRRGPAPTAAALASGSPRSREGRRQNELVIDLEQLSQALAATASVGSIRWRNSDPSVCRSRSGSCISSELDLSNAGADPGQHGLILCVTACRSTVASAQRAGSGGSAYSPSFSTDRPTIAVRWSGQNATYSFLSGGTRSGHFPPPFSVGQVSGRVVAGLAVLLDVYLGSLRTVMISCYAPA